jgi:putative acetyltransferase
MTAAGRRTSEAPIRAIEPGDDPAIADVIRRVMPEFGADGPGFAIHDAEVDAMFQSYSRPRSAYFVVEDSGRVVGGGGIAPLEGGPDDVCELRKMYFLPQVRGGGIGSELLQRCLEAARGFGFGRCYLETLDNMLAAQRLYTRFGFQRIDGPMGATGHFSCNAFYLLAL